jgi:hypothetical protein
VAIVIDPGRDIEQYLAVAEREFSFACLKPRLPY